MNTLISPSRFEDKFPLAHIGHRILAFLIDVLIYWTLGFIIGIFFGTPLEGEIGYSFKGFPAFVLFLLGFVLWPISEGLSGQTIGKRILNIKVVKDNLQPIGMSHAFGRFFIGFIDYMFLIGIIIAATNKKNKRIGDMIVNTIVVTTKK
jgi:uncharacterized RDD family membrane protein YckC